MYTDIEKGGQNGVLQVCIKTYMKWLAAMWALEECLEVASRTEVVTFMLLPLQY